MFYKDKIKHEFSKSEVLLGSAKTNTVALYCGYGMANFSGDGFGIIDDSYARYAIFYSINGSETAKGDVQSGGYFISDSGLGGGIYNFKPSATWDDDYAE